MQPEPEHEGSPLAELSHAGAVIDKAIEHLMGQDVASIAIASALLGGALGLLARDMPDDAILRILENASASVRAGELRGLAEPDNRRAAPARRA
jgi:hypothetical protein